MLHMTRHRYPCFPWVDCAPDARSAFLFGLITRFTPQLLRMGRAAAAGNTFSTSSATEIAQEPRRTRHSTADVSGSHNEAMLSGCAGSAEDCAQRRTSDAKAASLQLNPHGRRNSRRSNGATDGAVALVAAKSHKRAQPAAAGGGRSKVAKQGLVQQALAAAKDARPAGRKRPKRSDRSSVLEDAGSDFEEQPPQPPAGRTHAPHAASSSAAGPSSPGAASRSIPDELSGDEFDEDAEAAFHDTPHRMEADRRADFADRDEACEVGTAGRGWSMESRRTTGCERCRLGATCHSLG